MRCEAIKPPLPLRRLQQTLSIYENENEMLSQLDEFLKLMIKSKSPESSVSPEIKQIAIQFVERVTAFAQHLLHVTRTYREMAFTGHIQEEQRCKQTLECHKHASLLPSLSQVLPRFDATNRRMSALRKMSIRSRPSVLSPVREKKREEQQEIRRQKSKSKKTR